MKKIILAVIMALVVPAMTLAYFQPATLTNGVKKVAVFSQEQAQKMFNKGYVLDSEKRVSAVPGTNHINREYFYGGITKGGAVTALSTSTNTYTLTANDVCNSSMIKFTPTGAATTVTLPASSTAMFSKCLPSVGSYIDINWYSVSTSTTIAIGSGGTLGYVTSASVAAGKNGMLRIIRDTAGTYKANLINITN